MYLNEKGELVADLTIINWMILANKSVSRLMFGDLERPGFLDVKFTIKETALAKMELLKKVGGKTSALSESLPRRIALWRQGQAWEFISVLLFYIYLFYFINKMQNGKTEKHTSNTNNNKTKK